MTQSGLSVVADCLFYVICNWVRTFTIYCSTVYTYVYATPVWQNYNWRREKLTKLHFWIVFPLPGLWPPGGWAVGPGEGQCQSQSPFGSARSQRPSDRTEPTPCRPRSGSSVGRGRGVKCWTSLPCSKTSSNSQTQEFTHTNVSVVDQHTQSWQDLWIKYVNYGDAQKGKTFLRDLFELKCWELPGLHLQITLYFWV